MITSKKDLGAVTIDGKRFDASWSFEQMQCELATGEYELIEAIHVDDDAPELPTITVGLWRGDEEIVRGEAWVGEVFWSQHRGRAKLMFKTVQFLPA